MNNINKNVFLHAVNCTSLGWRARAGELRKPPTFSEEYRALEGREIGKIARDLHPEGALVGTPDIALAVERTAHLMLDSKVQTIMEATFQVGNYVTRADLLKRDDPGWHLIEVKSGVSEKAEYLDDAAYTTMVAAQAGVNVTAVSLWLLSPDYRLGMDFSELFAKTDVTAKIEDRVKDFGSRFEGIDELTSGAKMPTPSLMLNCRKCELFSGCVGEGCENHIFTIPRLSPSKFDNLTSAGIFSVDDIPPGYEFTPIQTGVVESIQSQQPVIRAGLQPSLDQIVWPAFYLDFETFMTALPLYPGIGPHAAIPFQYSIHISSKPGAMDDHLEYLADPLRDCRRELAEGLIRDLKGEGSILIYTSYERTVLRNLIGWLPDLGGELHSLIGRLVDLEAIIKNNYYHPDFKGRTTIKKTLPALVPEMSYDDLDIGEGTTAMITFAKMARDHYAPTEAERLKGLLLEYCEQDTLGMVKLHEVLVKEG